MKTFRCYFLGFVSGALIIGSFAYAGGHRHHDNNRSYSTHYGDQYPGYNPCDSHSHYNNQSDNDNGDDDNDDN